MMTTATAPRTATAPTVEAPSGVWQIDPSHTSLEFAVKHLVFTTVKGQFNGVSGVIKLDSNDLANSSVAVEIDAASIDTRDPKRDEHLRSADFLDAESYPKLTFRSKRVEPRSAGESRIIGDLTIHGISREIELEATFHGSIQDPWGGTRAGFSASTTIDRRDFNMEWNAALEAGGFLVGDQVQISLEVEAIKQ